MKVFYNMVVVIIEWILSHKLNPMWYCRYISTQNILFNLRPEVRKGKLWYHFFFCYRIKSNIRFEMRKYFYSQFTAGHQWWCPFKYVQGQIYVLKIWEKQFLDIKYCNDDDGDVLCIRKNLHIENLSQPLICPIL